MTIRVGGTYLDDTDDLVRVCKIKKGMIYYDYPELPYIAVLSVTKEIFLSEIIKEK